MNTTITYEVLRILPLAQKGIICLALSGVKGLCYCSKNERNIFLLFCFIIVPLSNKAQSRISKDSTEYIFSHSPAFSIFKDNYFISGIPMNEQPTKYNSDVKFQFSFKQRLQNKPLVYGAYFYLTYTQKSFWDIYITSRPFAETNYNPGLQLVKPIYTEDKLKGVWSLSLEHESNGRDSINSRSWNYLSISYYHIFSPEISMSIKAFIPFGLSDNTDLNKYIGYSETQFTWNIKKDRFILDVIGRKGASWDAKGSLMTNLSFRPNTKRNQYYVLQWWQGYGESLIDYKKSTSMIRIGLVIKPTFLRFY